LRHFYRACYQRLGWPRFDGTMAALRFKRWRSKTGLKLLQGLLTGTTPFSDATTRFGVPDWELGFLSRAMWKMGRRRSRTRKRAGNVRPVRVLAEELDVLRAGRPDPDHLSRLYEDGFRGRRGHFLRLLAFHDGHDESWNRWRRATGTVPDLRGANLAELDLRHVDLSHARLRGAELGGALARIADLRHADMRECRMRHCDLSYARLHHTDLRRAELKETLLTGAELNGADLRRAWLVGSFLNQADLRGADLRGAVVWGVATWDARFDERTKQSGLRMVPGLDPIDYSEKAVEHSDWAVRVDDLDVAHFMSLLVENPKLGRLINAAASRIVLLLGRFVGKEAQLVLNMLRDALPGLGYVPVVFDFEEPHDRDTIETVAILAGLASFVIADLSRPRSTPLETHLIIPAIAVPFVPIIREGEEPFAMFTALQRKYPWVLPTVSYRSEAGLRERLRKAVVVPAERAAKRMRRLKHPRPPS